MADKITNIQLFQADRTTEVTITNPTLKEQVAGVERIERLLEPDEFIFTLHQGSPSSLQSKFTARRIVKVTLASGTFYECRIVGETVETDGQRRPLVQARSIGYDLAETTVKRDLSGVVSLSVVQTGQTLSSVATTLLSTTYGLPAHFQLGTIETALQTLPVKVDLLAVSFFGLIRHLCEEAGCEFEINWNSGAGKYDIDFYTEAGWNATERSGGTPDPTERPLFGPGDGNTANKLQLARRADTLAAYSRMIPIAVIDDLAYTIQSATLLAQAAVVGGGTKITVEHPIIDRVTNNRFAGLQFGNDADGFFTVQAAPAFPSTTPPYEFKVTGNAAALNGKQCWFRDATTLEAVYWIDDYDAVQQMGIVEGVEEFTDVVPYANLVESAGTDADFETWDGWDDIGSPTKSLVTDDDIVTHGTKAGHVECDTDEGVSLDIAFAPTTLEPYASMWISLRVLSGRVRLEFVDSAGDTWPQGETAVSTSSEVRQIKVEGMAPASGTGTIRLVAEVDATIFECDAITFTQSATAWPYQEIMGPVDLFLQALKRMSVEGGLLPDAYEGELLDVDIVADTTSYFKAGGHVSVKAAWNGSTHEIDFSSRIVELHTTFDALYGPVHRKVRLSSKRRDFTERFRSVRLGATKPPTPAIPKPDLAELIRLEPFEAGDLGYVRIYKTDPHNRITEILARAFNFAIPDADKDNWSAPAEAVYFEDLTAKPFSGGVETVPAAGLTLPLKHFTIFQCRVTVLGRGAVVLPPVYLDLGEYPNIINVQPGAPTWTGSDFTTPVAFVCDAVDTASIKWLVFSSEQADPDAVDFSYAPYVNGHIGDFDVTGTAVDATRFGYLKAYAGAGGTGLASKVVEFRIGPYPEPASVQVADTDIKALNRDAWAKDFDAISDGDGLGVTINVTGGSDQKPRKGMIEGTGGYFVDRSDTSNVVPFTLGEEVAKNANTFLVDFEGGAVSFAQGGWFMIPGWETQTDEKKLPAMNAVNKSNEAQLVIDNFDSGFRIAEIRVKAYQSGQIPNGEETDFSAQQSADYFEVFNDPTSPVRAPGNGSELPIGVMHGVIFNIYVQWVSGENHITSRYVDRNFHPSIVAISVEKVQYIGEDAASLQETHQVIGEIIGDDDTTEIEYILEATSPLPPADPSGGPSTWSGSTTVSGQVASFQFELDNEEARYLYARARNTNSGITSAFKWAKLGPYGHSLTVTLSSPTHMQTDIDRDFVRLVWQAIADAHAYHWQVSEGTQDFDTDDMFASGTTNKTEASIRKMYWETDFYWRVRAIKDGVPGAWSSIFKFTTEAWATSEEVAMMDAAAIGKGSQLNQNTPFLSGSTEWWLELDLDEIALTDALDYDQRVTLQYWDTSGNVQTIRCFAAKFAQAGDARIWLYLPDTSSVYLNRNVPWTAFGGTSPWPALLNTYFWLFFERRIGDHRIRTSADNERTVFDKNALKVTEFLTSLHAVVSSANEKEFYRVKMQDIIDAAQADSGGGGGGSGGGGGGGTAVLQSHCSIRASDSPGGSHVTVFGEEETIYMFVGVENQGDTDTGPVSLSWGLWTPGGGLSTDISGAFTWLDSVISFPYQIDNVPAGSIVWIGPQPNGSFRIEANNDAGEADFVFRTQIHDQAGTEDNLVDDEGVHIQDTQAPGGGGGGSHCTPTYAPNAVHMQLHDDFSNEIDWWHEIITILASNHLICHGLVATGYWPGNTDDGNEERGYSPQGEDDAPIRRSHLRANNLLDALNVVGQSWCTLYSCHKNPDGSLLSVGSEGSPYSGRAPNGDPLNVSFKLPDDASVTYTNSLADPPVTEGGMACADFIYWCWQNQETAWIVIGGACTALAEAIMRLTLLRAGTKAYTDLDAPTGMSLAEIQATVKVVIEGPSVLPGTWDQTTHLPSADARWSTIFHNFWPDPVSAAIVFDKLAYRNIYCIPFTILDGGVPLIWRGTGASGMDFVDAEFEAYTMSSLIDGAWNGQILSCRDSGVDTCAEDLAAWDGSLDEVNKSYFAKVSTGGAPSNVIIEWNLAASLPISYLLGLPVSEGGPGDAYFANLWTPAQAFRSPRFKQNGDGAYSKSAGANNLRSGGNVIGSPGGSGSLHQCMVPALHPSKLVTLKDKLFSRIAQYTNACSATSGALTNDFNMCDSTPDILE